MNDTEPVDLPGAIVDQISTGLMVLGEAGDVVYLNNAGAAILGDTTGELPGAVLEELMPDFARRLSGDNGSRIHTTIRVACLDGRTVPLGCRTDPLRGPHHAHLGTLLVFQDLTEFMPARRHQRTEAIVGAFRAVVASLSHEIRNPLFAVSSGLHLLESEFEEQGESNRILRNLKSEVERIVGTLDRLLRVGEQDRQLQTAHQADVLIDQALSLHQDLIDQQAVRVEIQVAPDLTPLLMDAMKVLWVLSCVLRHQLMASQPGETLQIRVASAGGGDDSVVGFHFRRSAKSKAATIDLLDVDVTQSVHLELVFSREIALGLGGDIRIKNDVQSRSVVTVTLPLMEGNE